MQIDPIEAAIKAGEFDLVSLDEFNEFLQSQSNIEIMEETQNSIEQIHGEEQC